MTETSPAQLPASAAGAPGASRTGNAVARCGRPDRGQPLPSLWFERTAIKSQKEIDVPGTLATAAWNGSAAA